MTTTEADPPPASGRAAGARREGPRPNPSTRTSGWRRSTARSSWPGSGNRTPAPRSCWRTRTTPRWRAASWRCWTPPTGSPWWASTATGTTTSGRTGTTRRACGAGPAGTATAAGPRSGTSCWTWTPSPPPKARNGSSTAPTSSARPRANRTGWPCWPSPPTAATPTATASSTSSPAASWTRPPAALTCRRRRATPPGWTRTPCWSPPPPKACPRPPPPTPAPASSCAAAGPWPTAERLFEIPEDHMMALVAHDSTPGFERTFAVDWISFFEQDHLGAARRSVGADRRARRT